MKARRYALLLLTIRLLTISIAAQTHDETGEPAPRFRAKTMSGEQFNNESVKGRVVSVRVLDYLV